MSKALIIKCINCSKEFKLPTFTSLIPEHWSKTDENKMKKRGRPRSKRREIYGKLRDTVKSLMEKEGLSRAQAYRRAKKMHEKSHKK